MKDGFPVSIAELLTAGERPLPSEAVAIVLDVCAQVMHRPASPSVLPAISPGAVFIDASGRISIAGGVPIEDDQTVVLLGRLLVQMLPGPGTASAVPVPARLRGLAARAASSEGPGLTVSRFAAALRRFGPEQTHAAVRNLFERWRARRADGMLADRASGDARVERRIDRRAAPGADVFRRLLREADEDRYGAGPTAADEPRASAADRPRRHARVRTTIIVFAVLLLAGAGAAYWLNADERLPQIPLSPTIFTNEPAPANRGGWELLPEAEALAAEGDEATHEPFATSGTGARGFEVVSGQAAKGRAFRGGPSPRGTDHRP